MDPVTGHRLRYLNLRLRLKPLATTWTQADRVLTGTAIGSSNRAEHLIQNIHKGGQAAQMATTTTKPTVRSTLFLCTTVSNPYPSGRSTRALAAPAWGAIWWEQTYRARTQASTVLHLAYSLTFHTL